MSQGETKISRRGLLRELAFRHRRERIEGSPRGSGELEAEEDKLIGVALPGEEQVGAVVDVDAEQHRGRGQQRAPRHERAGAAPHARHHRRRRRARAGASRATRLQPLLVLAPLLLPVQPTSTLSLHFTETTQPGGMRIAVRSQCLRYKC
jgi:hypothetical protein